MAGDEIKKASPFRETWGAIKSTYRIWGPWAIGLGLFMAAMQLFYPFPEQPEILKQLHENPQLLKQHPEMLQQFTSANWEYMTSCIPFALVAVLVWLIFYYIIMVGYLRSAMVNSPPAYSIGSFFYWFSRVLWKYIRPILWMLIPFIGPFFYLRSTVRYAMVSPLAILRRGPELKKSWDMTEGNWWRIFLNQWGVTVVMVLIVWGVALVPLIVLLFAMHGDSKAPLYHGVISLIYGLSMGVGLAVGAIYCCTVYRVLLKERKQAA